MRGASRARGWENDESAKIDSLDAGAGAAGASYFGGLANGDPDGSLQFGVNREPLGPGRDFILFFRRFGPSAFAIDPELLRTGGARAPSPPYLQG